MFSPDDTTIIAEDEYGRPRLFTVAPKVPDDLDRIANQVGVLTGARIDLTQSSIQPLDNATWLAGSEQIEKVGGPTMPAEASRTASRDRRAGLTAALAQGRSQYAQEQFDRARTQLNVGRNEDGETLAREALRVLERSGAVASESRGSSPEDEGLHAPRYLPGTGWAA